MSEQIQKKFLIRLMSQVCKVSRELTYHLIQALLSASNKLVLIYCKFQIELNFNIKIASYQFDLTTLS